MYNGIINRFFKALFVHVHQAQYEAFYLVAFVGIIIKEFFYFAQKRFIIQAGNVRDLVAVIIKQRHIQDLFKIGAAVIPDVSISALWMQEVVPLLPDSQGMSLYTGNALEVFYGIP